MSLKKLETELSVIKEVYEQKPPYKHVSGFYPFEAEDYAKLSGKPVSIAVSHAFVSVNINEDVLKFSSVPKSAIVASVIREKLVDEKEVTTISSVPKSGKVSSIVKEFSNSDIEAAGISIIPKKITTRDIIVNKSEDNKETVRILSVPKSASTKQVN